MKTKPYLSLKGGQICVDKRYKNPDSHKREPICGDFELFWNGKKVDLSTLTKIEIVIDAEHGLIYMNQYHHTPFPEKINYWIIKYLKEKVSRLRRRKIRRREW